jgi:hypothetical protein
MFVRHAEPVDDARAIDWQGQARVRLREDLAP